MLFIAASQADEAAFRSSLVLPSFNWHRQTSTTSALARENDPANNAAIRNLINECLSKWRNCHFKYRRQSMFLLHDLEDSKKISTRVSEKASKGSGIFRNRRPLLAGNSYTQYQKSKCRLSAESGYRIRQISINDYGSKRPIAEIESIIK